MEKQNLVPTRMKPGIVLIEGNLINTNLITNWFFNYKLCVIELAVPEGVLVIHCTTPEQFRDIQQLLMEGLMETEFNRD